VMGRSGFRIRINSAIALTWGLLALTAACGKRAPIAPTPPPPAASASAPEPASLSPSAAKPSIGSFTVEPRNIERGQSATLRWSVSSASDISIDQGVGTVPSTGDRQVSPGSSTTYTLSVRGPGGADSRSVTATVTSGPPPPPPSRAVTQTRGAAEILASDVHDVYFDYDKFDIGGTAQQTLTSDAAALKQIFQVNPGFTVVVEGNCDERGSAEYNLGLGDRRSTSAKDFLVMLGVPADRLRTISYGKDRPVCTDQTEDCYQRNRHVHFSAAQ
jgi:peptidoglycan-associated lipoprotein